MDNDLLLINISFDKSKYSILRRVEQYAENYETSNSIGN